MVLYTNKNTNHTKITEYANNEMYIRKLQLSYIMKKIIIKEILL